MDELGNRQAKVDVVGHVYTDLVELGHGVDRQAAHRVIFQQRWSNAGSSKDARAIDSMVLQCAGNRERITANRRSHGMVVRSDVGGFMHDQTAVYC